MNGPIIPQMICIQRENSFPNPCQKWCGSLTGGKVSPGMAGCVGECWNERKFLVLLEVLLWALMHKSQIQWKENNEKC